jgi:hypothetical protein
MLGAIASSPTRPRAHTPAPRAKVEAPAPVFPVKPHRCLVPAIALDVDRDDSPEVGPYPARPYGSQAPDRAPEHLPLRPPNVGITFSIVRIGM